MVEPLGTAAAAGRSVRRAAAALAAVVLACPLAPAQSAWPDRPIRVIVPVPPGGTPDIVARLVVTPMATRLGQPMIVDNRGGAGGLIGAEVAAKALPDGYTLFLSSPGPLAILPHLQKKASYDPINDFTPIGLISSGPFLLIAHPSLQARGVGELLALARAQPGRLDYASAGNGAANHLAMELFKSMARVDLSHVPYKGAPQAVADVLAGQVPMMFNSIAPVAPFIKAGRLRVLGISSAARSPQLPEVPTIAESGVPGYASTTWFGLLAPTKTPRAIVDRLNEVLVAVVQSAELRGQFEAQGHDPAGGTPEAFGRYLRDEFSKYATVVRQSGARID
ncbi:MAG: tripartite tricarboxylate transporter substrate binding protein [Betaproteobacteria bacterium]|nr:tripartite tricarboxylate transporter substrate binding protein [Betaproteobacteria bacterium]